MFSIGTILIVFLITTSGYSMDFNSMVDDAIDSLPERVKDIENVKTIAIKEFEYGKDIEVRNVEEKVAYKLAKLSKFRVADRKSLNILLKEQSLSLSGITELNEINKIGKILNVDAFVFGKVNMSGDVVVINLEMRDVATATIIWNEEFIGEDSNKASLGFGIRLGTYSASSRTYVSGSGLKEFTNIQGKDNGVYIAFLFHFVQRMSFSKGFSFGIDGIFSRGDWQMSRYNDAVLNNNYNLYQTSTYKDYNLTLIPLVRVHPAYLFDWKNDVVVLYAGAGLSADYVELVGNFRLKQNNGNIDTGEKNYSKINLNPGNFAYKFGSEFRFTEKYSMFLEVYHLPEMTMKFEDVDSNIAPEFTLKSNIYYGLGAKYYFFSF